MTRTPILAALLPLVAMAQSLSWDDMPDRPGKALTFGVCSACHSMQIVMQQGMTREQWRETLDWMVEEQGMGQLSTEVNDQVLDYLSSVFSPQRPYFPSRLDDR